MRRTGACVSIAALALTVSLPAAGKEERQLSIDVASMTCLATRVQGNVVHAGPFTGGITPGYDVVNGRFRLHVDGYRVPHALTQKIPWFVSHRYQVGDVLIVNGRRLGTQARVFRQSFARAYSPDSPNQHVFPSIIAPPAAGCWQLTFRSGRVTGTLIALVSNTS
jgi:hypothetical protein